MKSSNKPPVFYYRLSLAIGAILLLIASTLRLPVEISWLGFPIILLVALLFNFPLTILPAQLSYIHILALSAGLLYGPVVAGWAVVAGVLLGYAIRRFWVERMPGRTTTHLVSLGDLSLAISLQIIPLILSLAIFGEVNGIANLPPEQALDLGGVFAVILLFALLHSALLLAHLLLTNYNLPSLIKRDWLPFALVEVGYVPIVFSIVASYPVIGIWTMSILASFMIVLVIMNHRINTSQASLERSLQELSLLDQVSEVLRSRIDLENLLTTIHEQVTQLMGVDNFYVAIFNPEEQRLWYPLAVKYGQRQDWPSRPLMPDRLTDRVIKEGKPLLLSPRSQDVLGQIGLPPSEDKPHFWMGVPLITEDQTIGCLAVFTLNSGTVFSQPDLNLLIILSGQISIAIQNTLLYEQVHRRADQLETLNRISALITASLDPQEVLEQVCRSVAQVGGGDRAAIFLLDPDKGHVFLAHAFRLSEHFSQLNSSFSVTHSERMRCLRTGQPVLSPTLGLSTLDGDYIVSLQQEDIQAFGEFPLTTPDGHIGILTVYFDTPHTFRSEEQELLQTFASQAALAVSNARLYSRVDMALSRRADQLSILEAVGRELAAAISSERLFEMILDYAMNFTHSTWGELSLFNPQSRTLTVKAARGYQTSRILFTLKDGLPGRSVSTQQPINVGNVQAEPEYIDQTGGSGRSELCIPLIHEGRVLGVLALQSAQANAYTENDQAFISQLAIQAAVAVVNAQLYSETQRRLRELSILYLVSTRLVVNPELEKVMQTVARSMEASLHTSSVGIYLWNEAEAAYQSHFNLQSPSVPDCNLPSMIQYAALESIQPALAKTGPLRITTRRGLELIGECRDCQALVFPLIASKQRLGMVLIHLPKPLPVSDDELQLLRAVVAQVSISLQNALLFQDISHGRDRLTAVLNSVGEGILMLESNGVIMLANEFIQTITRLSREELVNRWLPNLPENALNALGYSRQEAEALVHNLEQHKAVTLPKTTVKTLETKPEKVLERSTSPVWGQGGRIIGWLIVMRDVTEEYQIAQARELITGTLVHDLRSPISSVLSAVDVIEEVIPAEHKDDVIKQALRVAHNGAARMLGLIDTLLDISRMQSGKMDLNLGRVNMHTLVANSLAEFVPQANEYGIIMRNEVPEDLPFANADHSKMTRVITNLLDNAIKFTPAGGQITICAETGLHGEIIMKISDSGPGIPEEYREKIFERFSQIPGTHGRRRGSGLGLTFCRMAVEAHGGKIWVESRPSPATGSVFTFTLPHLAS